MIIDRQNHFNFGKQTITVSAVSTDVIDQGAAGVEYGPGALFLVSRVGTAFAASGAATLNIQLQTATDAAFTTPITVYDSGAIAVADLKANSVVQKVSLAGIPLKQYIRVNYVVGTGPMTAGNIESFLTTDIKVG